MAYELSVNLNKKMNRVLVIGANGTIGSAIKKHLLNTGYEVLTLTQAETDYSEQSLQGHYEAFKQSAPFSMIICCVGTLHNHIVAPEKRLSQLSGNVLTEYFRINTVIPSLCLRFFHPLLAKQVSSKFVCLSAMAVSYTHLTLPTIRLV